MVREHLNGKTAASYALEKRREGIQGNKDVGLCNSRRICIIFRNDIRWAEDPHGFALLILKERGAWKMQADTAAIENRIIP